MLLARCYFLDAARKYFLVFQEVETIKLVGEESFHRNLVQLKLVEKKSFTLSYRNLVPS
jgi:hypothetical protein